MIIIPLGLVVVPDGGLLAVGVPAVLAVLKEAVQNRLVLPLIVAAAQHQRVLYPNTYPGQVETCVHERPAETQSFCVRMKNIGRTSFLKMGDHIREGLMKELIKSLPFDGVILDGQPIRGLEGDTIGGGRLR